MSNKSAGRGRFGLLTLSITFSRAIFLVMLAGFASVLQLACHRVADNEIEYRGERIRLSRSYKDFSSYKNDPNNIDPTETVRVQRLVREAPIAGSFADRLEFARATTNIAFPGYGMDGLVDTPQPNGNVLVLTAIEIPRAQQKRYFTARASDGRYSLIDDFVAPESAGFAHVEQIGKNLVYFSDWGEKQLVRQLR